MSLSINTCRQTHVRVEMRLVETEARMVARRTEKKDQSRVGMEKRNQTAFGPQKGMGCFIPCSLVAGAANLDLIQCSGEVRAVRV